MLFRTVVEIPGAGVRLSAAVAHSEGHATQLSSVQTPGVGSSVIQFTQRTQQLLQVGPLDRVRATVAVPQSDKLEIFRGARLRQLGQLHADIVTLDLEGLLLAGVEISVDAGAHKCLRVQGAPFLVGGVALLL